MSEWIPKGWLQVTINFTVENFSDLKDSALSEPHYLQVVMKSDTQKDGGWAMPPRPPSSAPPAGDGG